MSNNGGATRHHQNDDDDDDDMPQEHLEIEVHPQNSGSQSIEQQQQQQHQKQSDCAANGVVDRTTCDTTAIPSSDPQATKAFESNIANGDSKQISIEVPGDVATAVAPALPIPMTPVITTESLNIADLIGEFGFYQLSLTILTFIRYICVAMMSNTGPLIAPRLTYSCKPPSDIDHLVNYPSANHSKYLLDLCELTLKNGSQYECTHWAYDKSLHGTTLTDTFDLVCGRDWLRSAFQSSVSIGVTIASIVFGSFSDEHGRKMTLQVSYTTSLIAGLVSYWAPNFLIYTLSRAICSMADLGIVNSLYTIIVETFGNKYRGTICLIVFTGWSMGVMVMPYVTSQFMDFKKVMLFTIVCHIATLPWLMTVGESIRWLLVNGRIKDANQEVRRICKWNSVSKAEMAKVENKFQSSKTKYQLIADRMERVKVEKHVAGVAKPSRYTRYSRRVMRTLFGGFFKVGQIFKSRELTITTIVMVWTTFNSELLYMLFVLINSDVGDNVSLNYAIGGLMEVLATLVSIVMIARLTRRISLSSTLTIISLSMFTLAFTHQTLNTSVWVLNFAKFAISTLSSLIYVTITELFPTSLRQTGMGLTATLASCGAVIAPFIRTELTDMIGMTTVMLALCLMPLSAAVFIPLHLRETKGLNLADDVDEIEQ